MIEDVGGLCGNWMQRRQRPLFDSDPSVIASDGDKMSDLNKVLLIGRLGDKPVLRQMPNGDSVTRLSVATSYRTSGKNGEHEKHTEWHKVSVFGKNAEHCAQFLDKGRMVFVEGSMHSHKWADKQGVERLDREVRAMQVTFVGTNPNKTGVTTDAKAAAVPF